MDAAPKEVIVRPSSPPSSDTFWVFGFARYAPILLDGREKGRTGPQAKARFANAARENAGRKKSGASGPETRQVDKGRTGAGSLGGGGRSVKTDENEKERRESGRREDCDTIPRARK